MLSICIPIYNFDISRLLTALVQQIEYYPQEVEIVCIDDCSQPEYKTLNAFVSNAHSVRYIQLDQNIGRAAIRNLFLQYVSFDYLLFLDCDSLIETSSFVSDYMDAITKKHAVICGGREYGAKPNDPEQWLRWEYGSKRESKSVTERIEFPFISFMTNNFCVQRSLLERLQFDERIQKYGHEDTLFGFELMNHNIQIHHIHNPVLNGDIESNAVFLEKTELGIDSLATIYQFKKQNQQFVQYVNILRVYNRFKNCRLHYLLSWSYRIFGKYIRNRILNGGVNLQLFDYYKLILLSSRLN